MANDWDDDFLRLVVQITIELDRYYGYPPTLEQVLARVEAMKRE